MLLDVLSVLLRGRGASRPMAATNGAKPVFADGMLFAPYIRRHSPVAVWIKQFARAAVVAGVIPKVDLTKTYVDPLVRHIFQCTVQGLACLGMPAASARDRSC